MAMNKENKKNKITIWDDPESIDRVLKTRINSFSKKGGKGCPNNNQKWTEEELELRDAVILAYICEQGLSREATSQQIAARWDIAQSTARKYVNMAITNLCNHYKDEETVEKNRKTFIERLEKMVQQSLEDNRPDLALKAMDLIGKASGAYQEKKEIKLEGETNIKFNFGN